MSGRWHTYIQLLCWERYKLIFQNLYVIYDLNFASMPCICCADVAKSLANAQLSKISLLVTYLFCSAGNQTRPQSVVDETRVRWTSQKRTSCLSATKFNRPKVRTRTTLQTERRATPIFRSHMEYCLAVVWAEIALTSSVLSTWGVTHFHGTSHHTHVLTFSSTIHMTKLNKRNYPLLVYLPRAVWFFWDLGVSTQRMKL